MSVFRNLSLRWKLVFLGVAGVFVAGLAGIGNSLFLSQQISETVQNEILKKAEELGLRVAEGVYNAVKTQDQLLRLKLQADLKMADRLLQVGGGLVFSGHNINWQAQNQFSGAVQSLSLPELVIDGQILTPNFSFDTPSPLVDEVQKITGITCTIFQRMNEKGDMLRVATNVKAANGNRAIGTFIPAIEPSGQPNKAVSEVLTGQTFIGRAFVVNAWYITAYQPILVNNRVVAMLYVGIPLEMVRDLRQAIMDIKIGKVGYAFVLGGSGTQKGYYIISEKGLRDGENIWQSKDASGDYFIQEMVNKTVLLPAGDSFVINYPWLHQGETTPRQKFSVMMYYEPWDWVIGAGSYFSDFEESLRETNSILSSLTTNTIYFSLFLILILGGLAWFFAQRISEPILRAVHCLDEVRKGNFSVRLKHDSGDEIGILTTALNTLASNLDSVVQLMGKVAAGDLTQNIHQASDHDSLALAVNGMIDHMNNSLNVVQETACQVSSGSEQLADASHSLSQGATEQAASLEEITSSIVEIASQSRANAENAEQASRLANEAKKSGELSRAKMGDMVNAVADISNSSREIAKIIKVIDDIAFQTNLLALNAAVEAARAGKHGKGFAVVAEEVRNLAARSAKAAKETAELIEDSVNKVEAGTKIADTTREALAEIITDSTKVADYLAEISAASKEQALGVEQVNIGLSQVDKVTQAISSNAEETAAASQELSSQSTALTEVLEQFKLSNEVSLPASLPGKRSSVPKSVQREFAEGQKERKSLKPASAKMHIALDDTEFGKY